MNICLFLLLKLPILVKICPTVIEIMTFINGLKSTEDLVLIKVLRQEKGYDN